MAGELAVRTTAIDGLLVVDLPLPGDSRGWFKENWQRKKMVALGLPDFGPVQNNISFNADRGVTRGIHAEPWDKFISVATGRVFGAWVDLREGPHFGTTFTLELGPETAVFVPRGVGNSFQTLENGTAYTYLVNDHWSAGANYTNVWLGDETLGIPWPIPLELAVVSEKDRGHPDIASVEPVPPLETLVLGAEGQLGRALTAELLRRPGARSRVLSQDDVDIADPASIAALDLTGVGTIINAAAYTDVDGAETQDGRRQAWAVNAAGVAALAARAARHGILLVTVSSEYVFDGSRVEHPEDETFSPLGVYGQSKAAGDIAVAALEHHYVVRTTWLVGAGRNFVRTMADLARRGVAPTVVDDQVGRLTFAEELARGILHLVETRPPSGTYNLTCSGEPRSWAEVARKVYALVGADPDAVTPVSTDEYFADHPTAAPRPRHSVLDLSRMRATGFVPRDMDEMLEEYLR